MSLSLEELTQKVRSGEALSQVEILGLAEGAVLETSDLNLIVSDETLVDEDSESIPDFQRYLHIACLQQKSITEDLVSQILQNALDDGDPEDVFPYWWEIIELSIDSKKLSTHLVSRLLEEILLFDYDEEILPEMQLRLIEKLNSNFDTPDQFAEKIQEKIEDLQSFLD